jgi:predicted nuclease of predicted toxin-antitoxin system
MIIWIDAQLSPTLALWINQNFSNIEACSVRALGLRDASDIQIFMRAKEEGAVVMSKDDDFQQLVKQFGIPPQIIWVSCGNTSNKRMREILTEHLSTVLELLAAGNELVEISDK